MDKKYLFFDIDGTLTDLKTKKVVPSALQALKELQENGHFVAICTGRAHYKARSFIDQIGVNNMVCCGGGGLVIDGKLVKNTPLDTEKCKVILNDAKRLGIGYLVMLDDSIDCYSDSDLFRQQVGERKEPTNYIIDPSFDFNKVDAIYKMWFSISKEDEHIIPSLNLLDNYRFEPEYLMYQYDAKKQGIIEMMDALGADIKDVVVFGDDVNDIVMCDPRWFSIAVGNAKPELKAVVDYVTDDNVNDGIYKACKKFGWI